MSTVYEQRHISTVYEHRRISSAISARRYHQRWYIMRMIVYELCAWASSLYMIIISMIIIIEYLILSLWMSSGLILFMIYAHYGQESYHCHQDSVVMMRWWWRWRWWWRDYQQHHDYNHMRMIVIIMFCLQSSCAVLSVSCTILTELWCVVVVVNIIMGVVNSIIMWSQWNHHHRMSTICWAWY